MPTQGWLINEKVRCPNRRCPQRRQRLHLPTSASSPTTPKGYGFLVKEQLTAEKVRAYFQTLGVNLRCATSCPISEALNFVLKGVFGGAEAALSALTARESARADPARHDYRSADRPTNNRARGLGNRGFSPKRGVRPHTQARQQAQCP